MKVICDAHDLMIKMCSQFSMKLRPITQEYFNSQIFADTGGTLKGEQLQELKCSQHELNDSSLKGLKIEALEFLAIAPDQRWVWPTCQESMGIS